MKQSQRIEQYLRTYPKYITGHYKEAADALGVHYNAVRSVARRLAGTKNKPKIDPMIPGKTSFKQTGETAEAESEKSSRIKTLEDLVAHAEIDLSIWDIERWVANKWEVGAKNDDGQIVVEPLFQVKAWLKAKKQIMDAKKISEQLKKDLFEIVKWYDIYPLEKTEGNLFVPCIFDLHLGKMAWGEETGEDYDLNIAKQRFDTALDDLISKATGNNIGRILFPVGNDLFNSDKAYPFPTTTNGTPQQDDTRWQKLFREGRKLIIAGILKLSQIAPVDVVMVYSNHDRERGFYLGEVLEAVFANHPNVTVDNVPKTNKYYQFGKVLIGTSHGDSIKPADAPLIMAQEVPQMWADTWYREFLFGHLHHTQKFITQTAKDYRGVIVTFLSSPSAADAWHALKNFKGCIKGAEGFVYNKEEGKVATVIHNIK
jgi:hypothetical protein